MCSSSTVASTIPRLALLLITHPGRARSFDYEDRWDGSTLIYTGRGRTRDQRLEGQNRDVAENRKRLFVPKAGRELSEPRATIEGPGTENAPHVKFHKV
jgi:hypothetical protein